MRLVLALALLAGPAAAQTAAASSPDLPRVELPVREVDLPNGDRRFATTLTIDGQPVEVGIDTGSTGLRVLPRGLGPAGAAAKGARISYSYGAGTSFDGEIVSVPVAAGAVTGSIKVMKITGVGCVAGHPDCPVAHADLAQYGIQGDGIAGQGFAAILGIRLQHDQVDNPFEQLGVHRWLVELPRNAGEQGRIVLNPLNGELVGFARVKVDGEGTTPGCLAGPERICGRAFFDTGAAGLRVLRAAPFRPWPDGTPATLTVGSGEAAQSMAVTVGRRDQAAGLLYNRGPADTRLSFGFAPYFHWSVLYDTDAHEIGLRNR